MNVPLSPETKRRLMFLFSPGDHSEVERLLIEECGSNLPFNEDQNATQLERIRFAAMKMSGGDMDRFRDAIREAQFDSRDLLVAVGFGNDPQAHLAWLPP